MQNDSIDNLRLDLNKEKVRGVIYVRRGDTKARTVHFTLVKDGKVVDLTNAVFCEILIHKPDDTENDQAMVRYGNELQYTFRTSDINVPGECKCMIQVTFADNAIVTSPEFSVMVYNQTIDQGKEESTNEYTAISQILVDVTDLKNEATDQADRAEAEADDAEDSAEAAKEYADAMDENLRKLQYRRINIPPFEWNTNYDPDLSANYPWVAHIRLYPQTDFPQNPMWRISGLNGRTPRGNEIINMNYVLEAWFGEGARFYSSVSSYTETDDSDILLYAIDKPTVELALEYKGV